MPSASKRTNLKGQVMSIKPALRPSHLKATTAEDRIMQFAIAIFTIGAVLILIGLVGGDLSYRGLTVPKVGVLPRFTTTIAGGVFLRFSLAVFVVASSPKVPFNRRSR
jgi:hypothetical protein